MKLQKKSGFPGGSSELERDQAYYDAIYKANETTFASPWNTRPTRTYVWYPALLLAEPPILDAGCGTGELAEMCEEFHIPYAAGFDFSERALAIARGRAPFSTFTQCNIDDDAVKTILQRQNYKTLVALEVLEHVYEDLRLLRRVPRGRVIVGSVPNFYTEGHVRWFADVNQVRNRYENVMTIETIVTEKANNGPNQWFLFKGVRK